MSTVGHFFFERGDGASPEVFTRVCEVTEIPEFGEDSELLEDTTMCSAAETGGSKSFNNGLFEGMELNIVNNRDPESTIQAQLIADKKANHRGNYRIVEELDGSPAKAWTFLGLAKKWSITPALNGINKFTFGLKIISDIVESDI